MPTPLHEPCSKHHQITCATVPVAAVPWPHCSMLLGSALLCFGRAGVHVWVAHLVSALLASVRELGMVTDPNVRAAVDVCLDTYCRYLRNLPSTFKEADLSQLFAPFGGVKVRPSRLPLPTGTVLTIKRCTMHFDLCCAAALVAKCMSRTPLR